jgi:hypothetical protein
MPKQMEGYCGQMAVVDLTYIREKRRNAVIMVVWIYEIHS